jgi:site-specific DNA recombinase
VKVALYARVSTERQQERGTVSSQLEALRAAARANGDEVIEEFVDDGYSGTRLDRPALDRLRDAAEAGVLDGVICLCADRLARVYAYQVLIIEELQRFGVSVLFLEGPAHGEDPQTTLLVQVQGVIAEYERAKIAERYRHGKLYRARQGEIPFWKTSYGHRRVVPADGGPARIEIFEPEAELVRWIFHAYVEKGRSIRQIALDLLLLPRPRRAARSLTRGSLPRAQHPRRRARQIRLGASPPDAARSPTAHRRGARRDRQHAGRRERAGRRSAQTA